MRNNVVVDASIALKWVLNEPDSIIAEALLNEWSNKRVTMVAPALIIYEVANALYQNVRKSKITFDRAKQALSEVFLTGMKFDFSLNLALSTRAIELTDQYGLPAVYDSHYLALAERKGCELWTADTRLWTAVQGKLTWVRWMSDYSTP